MFYDEIEFDSPLGFGCVLAPFGRHVRDAVLKEAPSHHSVYLRDIFVSSHRPFLIPNQCCCASACGSTSFAFVSTRWFGLVESRISITRTLLMDACCNEYPVSLFPIIRKCMCGLDVLEVLDRKIARHRSFHRKLPDFAPLVLTWFDNYGISFTLHPCG